VTSPRVIIFSGPSIGRTDVEAFADFEWRPPVAQGDVLTAVHTGAQVIGIIDGYFEGVPSVWHKEILWAISQGIRVFGASSMGALRAAELASFGMHPVGRIATWFCNDELEDDDEVAVLHAPAELGYQTLSLAMVNLRASLDKAVDLQLITPKIQTTLTELGKRTFYQQRSWSVLFDMAIEQKLVSTELGGKLKANLSEFEVDQKLNDALELLQLIANYVESGHTPYETDFQFEWTGVWDKVYAKRYNASKADIKAILPGAIIDELRLQPQHFATLLLRARLKQMVKTEAGRKRVKADRQTLTSTLNQWREDTGLLSRQALDEWMTENDISSAEAEALFQDEAILELIITRPGEIDADLLIDEIRLNGLYSDLKSRVQQKQLASTDQSELPKPPELLSWYFEICLQSNIPARLDEYIEAIGLADRDTFYRLLAGHYRYHLAIASKKG